MAKKPKEERWRPMQVAVFLGLSYQTARNRMMEGRYGPTDYNAKSRALTVLADRVREVKIRHEKRRAKHRSKRRKSVAQGD